MKFSKIQTIEKILIIRLSSMGDVLLSTMLPRILRKQYPSARIDIAVARQFSEIFIFNPYISNLFEYDKNASLKENKENLLKIATGKYDLIIDLQRNFRSFHLRWGLGKHVRKIKKNRLNKLSLVYFKRAIKSIEPIPLVYLKAAGVIDDGMPLELWLPNEKQAVYVRKKTYSQETKQVIALAPGAHHATKRWQPEKFAELSEKIFSNYKYDIILLGGVADKEICGRVKNIAQCPITDYSGASSIIETAKLLDSATLLITNDTGVSHISAVRQIPVITIFGSTTPDFGFSPFRVQSQIIEKQISCRPCTHIGRSSCPKKHFDCMNLITVDDVFIKVNEILSLLISASK